MTTRIPPGEVALLLDRVKREGGLPEVAEALGEQFDALGATTPLMDVIAQNAATNSAVLEALKVQILVTQKGTAAIEKEVAALEKSNEMENRRLTLSELRVKSIWHPIALAVAALITGAISGYVTGASTTAGEVSARTRDGPEICENK